MSFSLKFPEAHLQYHKNGMKCAGFDEILQGEFFSFHFCCFFFLSLFFIHSAFFGSYVFLRLQAHKAHRQRTNRGTKEHIDSLLAEPLSRYNKTELREHQTAQISVFKQKEEIIDKSVIEGLIKLLGAYLGALLCQVNGIKSHKYVLKSFITLGY